ncbi:unnamed protein product [Macrosiphum euphorbiae]|uniref:Aminopeptidase n=1 Tax=Macrosiphum euphorbiae TaxID=13131 RepID=A0AAV0XJW4_9HEMI|nr:unnamed protein product [Macrosiphum euphorbiae]
MTLIIKWMFVLVLAVVTAELDRIPEDEKLTNSSSAGLIIAPANSSIMAVKPWKSTIRLSPYVRPQQYSINLYPNIEKGSFVGSVNITIILDTAQSYIQLHSKGLNITATKLNSSSVIAFPYPEHEFLVVVPNEELSAGEYKLQISFEGSLLNKKVGFYQSSYNDSKNHEPHYIATSKFEPFYARLAFPCFDEPQLKSKFKISLTRPSGNNFIALSNMNQESEEINVPTNGFTTVHFANTVPMSTYLACFIVCDFQSLETVKADQGFPLTVYAKNGQTENMKYARNVGLKAINFYVKYFGIEYPLPKLDLIPIPDFISGAMENWGLVTFRETKVLFNESISSIDDEEAIALVVAHELAHMWFGNLVTMKWWNDLWLNEGFATYMKYKATQVVHPNWDVDTSFLIHGLQRVQYLDSGISSYAMVHDVSDSQQISEMFDVISYDKGSCVIRMLEGLLGEEVFRIGVSAYLKRFAFKNAETDDLWTELQMVTQNTINVKKLMDTWTRQAGFPVVSAVRNGTKLTLKQQRFFSDPNTNSSNDPSPYNYKWEIPITYTTSNNNTVHKFLLSKDEDSITIDIPDADWIKLNHRQVGYYIINYSERDWCLLNNLLEKNVEALSAADRSNLIHDAFSLAKADDVPYGIALNMTKYLSSEHHYVPWEVAATNLNRLSEHIYLRPVHKNLEIYIQQLLESITEDLWNDLSADRNLLQRKLRAVIFKLGCSYGLPRCHTKAYELFKRFLDDKIQPHPDIRYTVYYYGMSVGNDSEWYRLWDLFLNEQDPQEKEKLRDALTASKEISILTRLLQNAKNDSHVNSEDYLKIISQISHNPFGTQFVWDFLRDNWQYLVDRFSLNSWQLGNLIPSVCSRFNTQERITEMKIFFEKHPEAGAGKYERISALEDVSNNIKWLEKYEAVISNWLINSSF